MAAITDEQGSILSRALERMAYALLREWMRSMAQKHEVSKTVRELSALTGKPHCAVAFQSGEAARRVANLCRKLGTIESLTQCGNYVIVPKEARRAVKDVAEQYREACYVLSAKEMEDLEHGGQENAPAGVRAAMAKEREKTGRENDAVRILNPDTREIDTDLAEKVSNQLGKSGIKTSVAEGWIVFDASKRLDIVHAAETAIGGRAVLEGVFDRGERKHRTEPVKDVSEKRATKAQVKLIEELHDQNIVTDAELERFAADRSFKAARKLLNEHGDVVGKLPDVERAGGAVEEAAAKRTPGEPELRDDLNHNGVLDIIEDRDGDGRLDSAEDLDCDGVGDPVEPGDDDHGTEPTLEEQDRDIDQVMADATAEAEWRARQTASAPSRDVSLQVESR